MNNMATKLEAEFDSLSYSSETRRWNFEKYVSKHVELYHVAQVRKLLNWIKTDTLDAVRNQVMSDQVLAGDFDRVVNLFKDFLVQRKALFKPDNSSAGIAAVSSSKPGSNKRKNPRTSNKRNTRRRSSNISAVEVQDRYYTPQEYSQLSQDQKKALHELRKKRSRTAAVTSHEDQQEKTIKDESPEEEKSSAMTNRNNPALRQKTPKRNN
jgi:predicted HNH restriction endonuclease